MPAALQFLNTWPSMFGLRVLIALKERGVEYEYHEEDLKHKSQLLLESNPIHKTIPVLIHNGKPISESLIIVQYIDETWPSADKPGFLPKDPYDRAVARFWADYVDKKLFEAGRSIVRNPAGSEEGEQGKRELIEAVHTLDGALRDVFGGGPFFGGQHFGLVDVALAPFAHLIPVYETLGEFKIWEKSHFPRLQQWAVLVLEYPSVKETVSIAPPSKIVDFLRKWYHGGH